MLGRKAAGKLTGNKGKVIFDHTLPAFFGALEFSDLTEACGFADFNEKAMARGGARRSARVG